MQPLKVKVKGDGQRGVRPARTLYFYFPITISKYISSVPLASSTPVT
jgi:hypothetical protein